MGGVTSPHEKVDEFGSHAIILRDRKADGLISVALVGIAVMFLFLFPDSIRREIDQ
jgi:hypothetical protein